MQVKSSEQAKRRCLEIKDQNLIERNVKLWFSNASTQW